MSTQSPSFLYRLGRSSAAHPWRVIGAWVLVLATVSTLSWAFGAPMRDDWDVPGARAQQGIDVLREHGVGGYASARVIVHDGPTPTAAVEKLSAEFRAKSISTMEWLGRYSMTDVMVLALMIFYVNSSGYTEASVLPGVYFFAASVLITMLAYGWANTVSRRRG